MRLYFLNPDKLGQNVLFQDWCTFHKNTVVSLVKAVIDCKIILNEFTRYECKLYKCKMFILSIRLLSCVKWQSVYESKRNDTVSERDAI